MLLMTCSSVNSIVGSIFRSGFPLDAACRQRMVRTAGESTRRLLPPETFDRVGVPRGRRRSETRHPRSDPGVCHHQSSANHRQSIGKPSREQSVDTSRRAVEPPDRAFGRHARASMRRPRRHTPIRFGQTRRGARDRPGRCARTADGHVRVSNVTTGHRRHERKDELPDEGSRIPSIRAGLDSTHPVLPRGPSPIGGGPFTAGPVTGASRSGASGRSARSRRPCERGPSPERIPPPGDADRMAD